MQKIMLAAVFSLLAFYSSVVPAVTADEAKMIISAAKRGDDGSQVLLALIYMRGDGGYSKDNVQAAHWFELAATQGNPYAQKMLGDMYAEGLGVPQNPTLAEEWREKAANRGNIEAQYLLGKMYLNGEGINKNTDKAEHWLNRAATEGSKEAQYLLGKMHYGNNKPKEREIAQNWLGKSAAQGYEDAIHLLHFMEKLGYGVEESFFKRAPHIHKLAEDGDEEAQYQMGLRFENGVGVMQDYSQALHWFTLAAKQGHIMAMRSLADIYAKGGNGVEADAKQAAYWRKKADDAK